MVFLEIKTSLLIFMDMSRLIYLAFTTGLLNERIAMLVFYVARFFFLV